MLCVLFYFLIHLSGVCFTGFLLSLRIHCHCTCHHVLAPSHGKKNIGHNSDRSPNSVCEPTQVSGSALSGTCTGQTQNRKHKLQKTKLHGNHHSERVRQNWRPKPNHEHCLLKRKQNSLGLQKDPEFTQSNIHNVEDNANLLDIQRTREM